MEIGNANSNNIRHKMPTTEVIGKILFIIQMRNFIIRYLCVLSVSDFRLARRIDVGVGY